MMTEEYGSPVYPHDETYTWMVRFYSVLSRREHDFGYETFADMSRAYHQTKDLDYTTDVQAFKRPRSPQWEQVQM